MKLRIFIIAASLIFMLTTVVSLVSVSIASGKPIGILVLVGGLGFGMIVYFLCKELSRARKAAYHEDDPQIMLVGSTFSENQKAAASGKKANPSVNRNAADYYPDLERRQGAEKLATPNWMPDELKSHW
jgi:hypothetical protein